MPTVKKGFISSSYFNTESLSPVVDETEPTIFFPQVREKDLLLTSRSFGFFQIIDGSLFFDMTYDDYQMINPTSTSSSSIVSGSNINLGPKVEVIGTATTKSKLIANGSGSGSSYNDFKVEHYESGEGSSLPDIGYRTARKSGNTWTENEPVFYYDYQINNGLMKLNMDIPISSFFQAPKGFFNLIKNPGNFNENESIDVFGYNIADWDKILNNTGYFYKTDSGTDYTKAYCDINCETRMNVENLGRLYMGPFLWRPDRLSIGSNTTHQEDLQDAADNEVGWWYYSGLDLRWYYYGKNTMLTRMIYLPKELFFHGVKYVKGEILGIDPLSSSTISLAKSFVDVKCASEVTSLEKFDCNVDYTTKYILVNILNRDSTDVDGVLEDTINRDYGLYSDDAYVHLEIVANV